LKNLVVTECSLVDFPANSEIDPATGQKIPRSVVALWKRDADVAKSTKFLVAGDEGDHLPYTDESGKPDHNLMGAAWAALTSNHRGKPYEGPGKAAAIARLKQIYESEGMDTPTEKRDEALPDQQGVQPEVKGAASMTSEQIEKKLGDQDAVIATMKADNDALRAENATILKMSAKEKKAFDKMPAEKKKEFLAGDDKKKAALCKEFDPEEPDEDDMKKFEDITKAADERIKKADERIAKLETANAALLKRDRLRHFEDIAKRDLSHTSGADADKAAKLLKAADAMGGEESEDFKAHLGVLKAADEALAAQFVEKGTWGGGSMPAGATLEAKIQDIAKRDKISIAKATEVALTENPKLYEEYSRSIARA
jgi:hypothetical protein